MFIILFLILLVFFILNHTQLFQTKIRKNVMELKYACTQDQWFKSEGNSKLIICLHGMFSTPSTFEDFAHKVHSKGWDIYIPALPASALTADELRTIGPWAWEESLIVIREKIQQIPKEYDKTVLMGHSQGGSLSMQIASEREFDALIVVASPVTLYGSHLSLFKNLGIYISGLLTFLLPNGLKIPIVNQQERIAVEKQCDAEGWQFPYTVYTFQNGLRKLRKNLQKIHMPVFLSYCKGDTYVDFKNVTRIVQSVSSFIVETHTYQVSYKEEPYGLRHQLLNYNPTKENLFQAIELFINKI